MSARKAVLALFLALLAAAALPAAATAAVGHSYLTSFGAFKTPEAIAVDQTNGDIYVLDTTAKTVSRFDSEFNSKKFSGLGTSTAANVIDGAAPTTVCTGTPAISCDQTPFNGFSFETGAAQVAVDRSGNPLTNGDIYITDSLHRNVFIFAPTGVYIGALNRSGTAGPTFGGPTCGVAVDGTGAVYIGDATNNKIHKFVPTTSPPTNADFNADLASSSPCEIATGAGSTAGALFVHKRAGAVTKLSGAGVLQYQLSATGSGVAVDPSTGHAYVASSAEVFEYDAASIINPTLLSGFGSNQLTAASAVAIDGVRGRAYVANRVTGKIYVFGPLAPAPVPVVANAIYSPFSGTRVSLFGSVDAGSLPTTYYFEYGAADCATSTCTSVPAGRDAVVGKGLGPIRISQVVSGLQPATTYHYRLVATNASGSTASGDATFSTLDPAAAPACPNAAARGEQHATSLPDCRAYEMVSMFPAAERNGAEVIRNTQRVRAAAGGGAFQFTSPVAGGDIEGAQFTGDYMAVRDAASGWSVHGLTPYQPPLSFGLYAGQESRYLGEFSPGLSKAVFLATSPLNDEGPNVRQLHNFYLREDLLSPGPGRFRLLSDAATFQSAPNGDTSQVFLAGVSADLSHVLFESPRNLTADAALLGAGQRLYESVDGVVRMVGVLPAGEGGGPTIAQGGQGGEGHYSPHVISADGSRLIFTAPPYENFDTGGTLYLRDDQGTAALGDDSSVRVNATEKTNGAGPGGADPIGPRPAYFADASTDMSKVFFRSGEALTNDAPSSRPTELKLYRYEAAAPSGNRLTLISVDQNPADEINNGTDGVIGASDDGSYLYFVSSNQLLPARPVGSGPRIFVWHQGVIREVGAINAGTELNQIVGGGTEGWRFAPRWTRLAPDGRHLVFVSEGTGELTGNDHGSSCPTFASNRCKEVYLYSAAVGNGEGRLQCVSCNQLEKPATGDAEVNSRDVSTVFLGLMGVGPYLNHALSDDGRFVFFTSDERISPYDENAAADVYEFDTKNGGVSLISGGRPETASYFLDASVDGDDVFFLTRDSLLGSDGNQFTDVYDARVGGGFAEAAPPAPPCATLSSCRPATSTAPAGLVPESASASPPSIRKHQVRRKHRVKRHGKNRHRHRKVGARNG